MNPLLNPRFSRRLEDRIRLLCERLVTLGVADSDEFDLAVNELRAALAEHVDRLRRRFEDRQISAQRRAS